MTLATVEDRGGVVAAAEALHLTPSAVSQQLRLLEREAGVALLDRSGRQVRLTEPGRRLADRGRRIAREVVFATDDLTAWTDAPERTVTIAAFQTAICQLIAPVMGDGLTRRAGITVRIVELEGRPAIEELHAGNVDVVMTEELLEIGTEDEEEDELSFEPTADPVTRLVIDDHYRIVVPAGWDLPIDQPERLRADLVQRDWVSQPARSAGGAMLAELERRWAFSARIVHRCSEYTSAVALVAAGTGATLAPHLALPLLDLDTSTAPADVRLLEGGPDLAVRRVRALTRPSRRPMVAVDRVLSLLAQQATALGLRAALPGRSPG